LSYLSDLLRKSKNWLGREAKQGIDFVRQNPTPISYIQRQAPQVRQQVRQAQQSPQVQRLVQSKPAQILRGAMSPEISLTKQRLLGGLKAANTAAGIGQRLSPMSLIPSVRNRNAQSLQKSRAFVERNAPTNLAGKTANFMGEQLPYLAIPMGEFGKLGMAAKIGKNALIGAGFGAATPYSEGRGAKEVLKGAGMGAVAGAGLGLATEGVGALAGKFNSLAREKQAIMAIVNPKERQIALNAFNRRMNPKLAAFAKLPEVGKPTPLSGEAKQLGDVKNIEINKLQSIGNDRQTAIADFNAGKGPMTDLPILVRKEANGSMTVLDGNGRIAKALSEGKTSVPVTTNEVQYRKLTSQPLPTGEGKITGKQAQIDKMKKEIFDMQHWNTPRGIEPKNRIGQSQRVAINVRNNKIQSLESEIKSLSAPSATPSPITPKLPTGEGKVKPYLGSSTRVPSNSMVATNLPETGVHLPSTNLEGVRSSSIRYTDPSQLKNLDAIDTSFQSKSNIMRQVSQDNVPAFTQDLQKATGIKPNVRVKPEESLIGKMDRYQVDRKPISSIHDTLGGVVKTDLNDIPNQIRNIDNNFNVKDIRNYQQTPNEWGYKGVNIKVELPNGMPAEIQIHTPESWQITQKQHKLYEKWRNVDLPNLPPEQKAQYFKDKEISNSFYLTPKTEGVGVKLVTKPIVAKVELTKSLVRTPDMQIPIEKVQQISKKVGADVSFDNTIHQTATDVKSKVNVIDMFRTPDRVLEKIGLANEAKLLRTQYDKYLKELPQEIDKISQWAKQTTPEENNRIFKYLDGQSVQLNQKEFQIAGEVKTYLKGWANKLKLPEDKRITNYITHIFDKDFIKKEFPEELAKLIDEKVAGSVYDPFVSERLGKMGYVEDTWRALEAYAKRATRKYNIDTALEPIKKKAETLELSQFKYVKNYIDRINMRPTELDNTIDNFIKSSIGYKFGQRPTTSLTRGARQMVYRGTLGLNVGSTLKNLSQGANTYARLGERYTVKGYLDMFKNFRSSELKDVGILKDDLIQDKNLGVYKGFLEKLDKGLFYMFETAEKINRGAAYYGAKAKALNEGKTLQEAVDLGKKTVRDTQFTFGSIDTPPVLQSDAAKTLLQFQSFNIKQGEFLAEMISKKDFAGLTRWLGASMIFVYGVGKAIGMSPKDIIPTIRVGGSPIFTTAKEGYNAITNAPDQYGNKPENLKERITPFAKSLIPLIPGGVQAKKTIEGFGAANRGFVPTVKGLVRNPITPNISNKVRGALFGQNNLPESQQYFENEQTPLGKEQSNIFKTVSDKAGYYKGILSSREQSKVLDQLKAGKTPTGTADLGNGLYQVGDKYYSQPLDKTFGSLEKATEAVDGQKFLDSGKAMQIIGEKVYRADNTERGYGITKKIKYDTDLTTQKLENAKSSKNMTEWMKLAEAQEKNIQIQLQDPTLDELEKIELQQKYDKLIADATKFASYGGFTKGKSGGKAKKAKKPKAPKALPKVSQYSGPKVKSSTTMPKVNLSRRTGRVKISTSSYKSPKLTAGYLRSI